MSNQAKATKKRLTALQQIAGLSSLERAFDRMLELSTPRTRNGFGVDGESINELKRIRDHAVNEIRDRLLSKVGYQFRGLRAHVLIKPDGRKKRIICVPTVRDRLVQRAVLAYLSQGDKCKLSNGVSFGFVPKRGVKRAAEVARDVRKDLPFAYKTDISAFFDNVERPRIEQLIHSIVRQRSLRPLLTAVLHCEIEESNPRVLEEIASAGIKPNRGVRQGMPLSPFFANLYLRGFDAHVERRKIRMVRYADDLIFFARSQAECIAIHDFVVDELGKLGLSIPAIGPESKTRIFAPNEPAEFLGVELTPSTNGYVLEVNSKQIEKACKRLRDICDPAAVRLSGTTLSKIQMTARAIHIGYLEAYRFTNNVKQLENFLQNCQLKAMASLVENMLGVSVGSLNPSARRFLGIDANDLA